MQKSNVIPERQILHFGTLSYLVDVFQLMVLAKKISNHSLDILTAIHSYCLDLVATRPRWDHFLSPGPLLRKNINVNCVTTALWHAILLK